tara:strand:- start:140 stop:2812 length:2673 start_codon:yes stop_codon:yes gene_type:complete
MNNIISNILNKCEFQPNKVAIKFNEVEISYSQLEYKSRLLSLYLKSIGLKAKDYIGLFVDKDESLVIMILAVLRIGAIYVPIDINSPKDRIKYIISNANLSAILTNKKLLLDFDILNNTSIIEMTANRIDNIVLDSCSKLTVEYNIKISDTAYIIYTSGTTGNPKGVIISHFNLASLFNVVINDKIFNFTSDDNWSQLSSYAFDFSIWEIFGSLVTGGTLHIIPDYIKLNPKKFYEYLLYKNITILNNTPSYFYNLSSVAIDHTDMHNNLRLVIFGGEALNFSALKPWYDKFTHNLTKFINMYGITETTIHATIYKISKSDITQNQSIIGKPLPSHKIYILDNNKNPVKKGQIGELYVAGLSVSQGYLNNILANKKNFIDKLIINDEHLEHIYASGDLVKINTNNDIEYHGRKDSQIKIRGYRIEIGEVESILNSYEYIEHAHVFKQNLTNNNCTLSAIVIPSKKICNNIKQLKVIKNQADQKQIPLMCLPNGLPIFYLNIDEVNYMYDELFIQNNYLKNGITINDNDVIFDVGANIGMFSIFASNVAKNLNIYAFEPAQNVYDILKLNLQYYNKNALIFSYGISNKIGISKFTYLPEVSVMSSIYSSKEESRSLIKNTLSKKFKAINSDEIEQYVESKLNEIKTTISLTTISNIIEEYNITTINLLKVDVEKSELDVINGIKSKHWAIINQVVLEVHGKKKSRQIAKILQHNDFDVAIDSAQYLDTTNLQVIYAKKSNLIRKDYNRKQVFVNHSFKLAYENNLIKMIKKFCNVNLLPYMIPSKITILSRLPTNINGKIDTSRLININNKKLPLTETQKQLHIIFKRLLNLNDISIDAKFNDCGGYSLLSFQLLIEIKKTFNLLLKPSDVQNVTIFDLSKYINNICDHQK